MSAIDCYTRTTDFALNDHTRSQFGFRLEELGNLEVLHVELGLLSGRQISQHFAHDGAELEACTNSQSSLSNISTATDHGRCTHC